MRHHPLLTLLPFVLLSVSSGGGGGAEDYFTLGRQAFESKQYPDAIMYLERVLMDDLRVVSPSSPSSPSSSSSSTTSSSSTSSSSTSSSSASSSSASSASASASSSSVSSPASLGRPRGDVTLDVAGMRQRHILLHDYLSWSYFEAGRSGRALEHANTALHFDPDNERIKQNVRSWTWGAQSRLSRNPHFRLGREAFQLKRWPEVVTHMIRTLSDHRGGGAGGAGHAPHFPMEVAEVHGYMSWAFGELGDYALAIKHAESFLRIDVNSTRMLSNVQVGGSFSVLVFWCTYTLGLAEHVVIPPCSYRLFSIGHFLHSPNLRSLILIPHCQHQLAPNFPTSPLPHSVLLCF